MAYGKVRNYVDCEGIHGDSYIGEWKNSKADGYGVHIWKNGNVMTNDDQVIDMKVNGKTV